MTTPAGDRREVSASELDDPAAYAPPRTKDYNGLEIVSTPDLQRLHRRLRGAVWWLRKITAWMKRNRWYCHDTLYRHIKDAAGELDQAVIKIGSTLRRREECRREAQRPPATVRPEDWLK